MNEPYDPQKNWDGGPEPSNVDHGSPRRRYFHRVNYKPRHLQKQEGSDWHAVAIVLAVLAAVTAMVIIFGKMSTH